MNSCAVDVCLLWLCFAGACVLYVVGTYVEGRDGHAELEDGLLKLELVFSAALSALFLRRLL